MESEHHCQGKWWAAKVASNSVRLHGTQALALEKGSKPGFTSDQLCDLRQVPSLLTCFLICKVRIMICTLHCCYGEKWG